MEKELLATIASEDTSGDFSGDHEVKEQRSRGPVYRYKVWNQNMKKPTDPTPGIVMTKEELVDGQKVRTSEVVPSVKAVILYHSSARTFNTGQGKDFRVVCASHDSVRPSLKIAKPLCRSVKASDLAATFSQWKNYDQAKVEAQTNEVCEGTGELQLCGIKAKDGVITLCPYGKWTKDPITGVGKKPQCKSVVFVHAYDIERKREFFMELAGQSIDAGKFISPFFQFIKFLRSWGKSPQTPNAVGLPSYAFVVNLSAAENRGFYYLNVSDYQGIQQAENRADMRSKAERARNTYLTHAMRPPKEEKKATVLKTPLKHPPLQPTQPIADPENDPFDGDDIPF